MGKVSKNLIRAQAGIVAALFMGAESARANDWSNIAENITNSISQLPGMITGVSYLMGLLLGVLGVMKVKDHVENPGQTPLKDGAIRMASGGALFALPIVYESMQNTIGTTTTLIEPATLNAASFNVN